MSKSLTVDAYTIKFQIWDTAGQERVSTICVCVCVRVCVCALESYSFQYKADVNIRGDDYPPSPLWSQPCTNFMG